jgi:hypothetical protein
MAWILPANAAAARFSPQFQSEIQAKRDLRDGVVHDFNLT